MRWASIQPTQAIPGAQATLLNNTANVNSVSTSLRLIFIAHSFLLFQYN
jgi:hypothetical protein